LDSDLFPIIKFITKTIEIPIQNISQLNKSIICNKIDIKNIKDNRIVIDYLKMSILIDNYVGTELSKEEVIELANDFIKYNMKKLKSCERVYAALYLLKRPSHYSEITEIHNKLFPNKILTEHNTHATLDRCENVGIVWVGVRGTYALKEWGYEKPSKTLFDTVSLIVKKIYEKTGRPVSMATIKSEIGKYRKIINPNSLIIATQCNKKIKQITKDKFIPHENELESEDTIEEIELDEILQKIEKSNNYN
ncbi:MAG: hypothetical protein DRH44_07315, partial [Candidatus Coatesbacteria bacterium]